MIWVYAICDHPALAVPRRRGLAHAPLEGVVHGELVAVVTQHRQSPAEAAVDALWAHERVVERLMTDRTVLPMRFGTRAESAADLRARLAARHDELLAVIERVRGRVEIGLRVMRGANGAGAAPAARVPRSGSEYLIAKLEDGRRDAREAAALHEPLRALAAASRERAPQGPDEVLRAAYLVERAAVPRMLATVSRLQRECPDVSLLCTGPWPPYSFVE